MEQKEVIVLKNIGKKWLAPVIALLIAVVVLTVGLADNKEPVQYDVVFLGDSIIGNEAGKESIVKVIEERLEKTVYNGAFGGSCMSFGNDQRWESSGVDQWSMVKLAQAIYADDFYSQLALVTTAEKYRNKNLLVLDYFEERLKGLAQVDFSEVELLLIEHGTNDYNLGQMLESDTDPYDMTTFAGALRTTLSLLQDKYPNMQIVLISPIYCELRGDVIRKSYETDLGGGILDEYVQKEKEIAEEFGVEWIDMYHESGIWEENAAEYLFDGLHLTDKGKVIYGNKIADYLIESDDVK